MATGSLDANGIWQYGEDDSNTTFSALLNRLGSSTSTQMEKALYTGRVIQTVSATYSTAVSTTSSSYVTTNLQASITPRFSSSKILVLVSSALQNTGAGQSLFTTIYRGGMGGTNLGSGGNVLISRLYQANGETIVPYMASVYDSPATTSSTTYTWAFKSGGGTVYVQPDNGKATITLMEISA